MARQLVGMVSSYSGLNQADWLWKQTPRPFGVWETIQMQAQAESPDYLLLYQFNFHKLLNPPKLNWRQRLSGKQAAPMNIEAHLRSRSKESILFLLREPPLPEVQAAHKRNYALAQAYCTYVSGPDDDAPQPNYMPAIWYVNCPFQHLNEAPPPPKVRSCSWITSGVNRTESHRQRLRFLQRLQEHSIDVEVYGRGLPTEVRSLGRLENKWFGMAPYYYNLAIENYAGNDWYVSEKLWDALLSWCLPIYYGGSAADDLLPPGSFLRLPSLDDKGIAYIQEATASPDAWFDAKNAIAEARQVILHKLNLLNWLSEHIAGML